MSSANVGCQALRIVEWEEHQCFKGFEKQPQQFLLNVASTPSGATVILDGTKLGVTPLITKLTYSETIAMLERRQIERQGKDSRVVNGEEDRRNAAVSPAVHELILRREGHVDSHVPIIVQLEDAQLDITLARAGVLRDIDCPLTFTAREDYFEYIREVLGRYYKELGTTFSEDRMPVAPDMGVYQQQLNVVLGEIDDFGCLVDELQTLADDYGFVFHITDANVDAEFDTHALRATIEHVLKGRVRPGCRLYLVRRGVSPLKKAVGPKGEYEFAVTLRPNEREAYLLSKYVPVDNEYAPPLLVFMKLNVHSEEARELDRDDVIRELAPTG